MNISENIKKIHEEVTTWRHELHANPELCYEENWTAEFITEKLKSFGIEVIINWKNRCYRCFKRF